MRRTYWILLIGIVTLAMADSLSVTQAHMQGEPGAGPGNAADAGTIRVPGAAPRAVGREYGDVRWPTNFPIGYVTSFGAFSLPEQTFPPTPGHHGHAMFMARTFSAPCWYCFYDGPMTYNYFAFDPCFCVVGWLYTVDVPGAGIRHFLFGAKTVDWCCGVAQRHVIVYDEWWNRINFVCANYAESCSDNSRRGPAR
jgi:hypothetical protein